MARTVTVTYSVCDDAAAVARACAELFAATAANAAAERGVARVAISGGSTPIAMFALLADPDERYFGRVPWDKMELYWVDERCVGPEDADSNYGAARKAMLSKVPLPEAKVFRMEGELDPEVAAHKYESQMRNNMRLEGAQLPTLDLVMLGMGDDGHTASLFPHTDAINELGRYVVANHVPQKDTWRVTLTWPVINQAREVAFQIVGGAKAGLLREVLLGKFQPETLPSQLIRPANGRLTMLLDAAVAAELPAPSGASVGGCRVGSLELSR